MTDDELREASDPTTPGERLREMVRWERQERSGALLAAWVHNSSLPLDALDDALRSTHEPWCPAAWTNPSVPLLLMASPLPTYQAAAAAVLHRMGQDAYPIVSAPLLASLVAAWAHQPPSERAARVRALCRHLAGLFGLPWPSG